MAEFISLSDDLKKMVGHAATDLNCTILLSYVERVPQHGPPLSILIIVMHDIWTLLSMHCEEIHEKIIKDHAYGSGIKASDVPPKISPLTFPLRLTADLKGVPVVMQLFTATQFTTRAAAGDYRFMCCISADPLTDSGVLHSSLWIDHLRAKLLTHLHDDIEKQRIVEWAADASEHSHRSWKKALGLSRVEKMKGKKGAPSVKGPGHDAGQHDAIVAGALSVSCLSAEDAYSMAWLPDPISLAEAAIKSSAIVDWWSSTLIRVDEVMSERLARYGPMPDSLDSIPNRCERVTAMVPMLHAASKASLASVKSPADSCETPLRWLEDTVLVPWYTYLINEFTVKSKAKPDLLKTIDSHADSTVPSAAPLLSKMIMSSEMVDLLRSMRLPFPTSDIVFMAQTGSYSYNLSTSTSDTDYTIIYRRGVPDILTPFEKHTFSKRADGRILSHVDRGFGADKAGDVEFSALPLDVFLEDLVKGNPRNVELLFGAKERQLWLSARWDRLVSERHRFLNETMIDQYFGFVEVKMHKAKEHIDQPKLLSKSLYAAFHKLYDLARVLRGEDPIVALPADSEERDVIMQIRESPRDMPESECKLFLHKKLQEAKEWLDSLQAKTDARRKEIDPSELEKRFGIEGGTEWLCQFLISLLLD